MLHGVSLFVTVISMCFVLFDVYCFFSDKSYVTL